MYLSYKNQHGVTSRAAQQLKKQFTSWAEHKGVSASGAEFVERDGAYSYDEYGDADLFIDATSSGLHVLRDPHVNKVTGGGEGMHANKVCGQRIYIWAVSFIATCRESRIA